MRNRTLPRRRWAAGLLCPALLAASALAQEEAPPPRPVPSPYLPAAPPAPAVPGPGVAGPHGITPIPEAPAPAAPAAEGPAGPRRGWSGPTDHPPGFVARTAGAVWNGIGKVTDYFRDPCATITPGAMPAPNGAYVRRWHGLAIEAAQADDFVVYNHEWYLGGANLGPYGCYHLDQIVKRLAGVPFPVVLAPGGPPELTETRRLFLVNALASAGVPDAANRVVVAYPQAGGLYGEEAIRIFPRLFTITGGRAVPTGVGAPLSGTGGVGGLGAFGVFGGAGITGGRGGY